MAPNPTYTLTNCTSNTSLYGGGDTCTGCGVFIYSGFAHECPGYAFNQQQFFVQPSYPAPDMGAHQKLDHAIELLEKLLEKMEPPSHNECEKVCGHDLPGGTGETPDSGGSRAIEESVREFRSLVRRLGH